MFELINRDDNETSISSTGDAPLTLTLMTTSARQSLSTTILVWSLLTRTIVYHLLSYLSCHVLAIGLLKIWFLLEQSQSSKEEHLWVTIDVHDAIGTLIELQDDFTSSDRQLIAAESQSLRFTCQV